MGDRVERGGGWSAEGGGAARQPTRALFLDRDGVVNVDNHYVGRKEDFVFIDGIFELCRTANRLGYAVVIVTNQSGIERGYFTEDDFAVLTDWMLKRFAEHGVRVAGVYHCPSLAGPDRKPEPGLFLRAAAELRLDLARSISLGDKERDVEAGRAARVGVNVLLTKDGASASADRTIRDLTEMKELL